MLNDSLSSRGNDDFPVIFCPLPGKVNQAIFRPVNLLNPDSGHSRYQSVTFTFRAPHTPGNSVKYRAYRLRFARSRVPANNISTPLM